VFAVEPDASALPHKDPVLDVSLFQLLEAFRRVLKKLPADERHHEVSLERVTLQDRMIAVMDRLRAEPKHAMLLEDLLSDGVRSRHLLVVTFLALLELAKIQALRLFQNSTPEGRPFGPVRVHLAVIEGEGSDG
jgi:segregation and condensation protein A